MAWATSRRPRCSTSSRNSRPIAALLVVSGPSGAGKTSVVAGLLKRRPDVVLSVSATTRRARPGEQDGTHYLFLTPEEFARRESAGEFLETAEVHGNRYGTPRAAVQDAIRAGKTVLLEIDVQGARSVREAMPEAVLVFIEPPTADTLQERLEGRGTEPPEVRERRLRDAAAELAAADRFDHRIVNEDLEEAVSALVRILEATSRPSKEHP